jgi:hypothetical protein
MKELDAQRDFMHGLIASIAYSDPLDSRESKLVNMALRACNSQPHVDQLDLVVNLQKALYFGPGLSLADGVNSELSVDTRVRCLDYYRELRKTRPEFFITLERDHPWLLAPEGG